MILAVTFHSVYRSMPEQYSIVEHPVTQAATALYLLLNVLIFRKGPLSYPPAKAAHCLPRQPCPEVTDQLPRCRLRRCFPPSADIHEWVTQAATALYLLLNVLIFRKANREIAGSWLVQDNKEEEKLSEYYLHNSVIGKTVSHFMLIQQRCSGSRQG